MSAARRSRAPYTRQVFINCPYDDEYRPLLKAIVFAVHACEFTARLALEEPGSERLRIHDLSRVRSSDQDALPRFNINALYEEFQTDLPQLAREADLEATELEPLTAFNDWHFFAGQWLTERARQAR